MLNSPRKKPAGGSGVKNGGRFGTTKRGGGGTHLVRSDASRMHATPAMAGKETSDEGYDTTSISSASGGGVRVDADAVVGVASLTLLLLPPPRRASGPPPASSRSRSNVSTRYLTRPSPGSGRLSIASSIAVALSRDPPRRLRSASSKGDERLALTLPPRPSDRSRALAVVGVEHLAERELVLVLLLLAVLETEAGEGPAAAHLLAAALSQAHFPSHQTRGAATFSTDAIALPFLAGDGDASTANGRRAAPRTLLAADAIPPLSQHESEATKKRKPSNRERAGDADRRLMREVSSGGNWRFRIHGGDAKQIL
jgi:hypothetical protein